MKLNQLTFISAALLLALSTSVSAGSKPQTPLVQPTSFYCSWEEGSAASNWDDSNTNAPNPLGTKYGGDLETTINYGWSCDADGDPETTGDITTGSAVLNVETDLSSDQTATYHYSCAAGSCTGIVDGSAWWQAGLDALSNTKASNCPTGTYATSTNGKGEGFSVSGGVKAMIPGKNKGPQNYTQTVLEPCDFTGSPP